MKTTITDLTKQIKTDEKRKIKKNIIKISHVLKIPKSRELSLVFIHDNDMRELYTKYKGTKRTTDVLSFPQDYQLTMTKTLGDIIISTETAQRNAKRFNVAANEEINRLIIHGLLHLLGYDHKKPKDRAKMRMKETELLKIINSPEIHA